MFYRQVVPSTASDQWIKAHRKGNSKKKARNALRKVRHANECDYCGKRGVPLTVDHILPISRGGSSAVGNLCWACEDCNTNKQNQTLYEIVFENEEKIFAFIDQLTRPGYLPSRETIISELRGWMTIGLVAANTLAKRWHLNRTRSIREIALLKGKR